MMPIRGVIRRVGEVIWPEKRQFATKTITALFAPIAASSGQEGAP
jgi:hypothetical protein